MQTSHGLNKENMDKRLRKITDYLLLKSLYMQDVGLFHGKMGIVLTLYANANRYQDDLIEEYAWDLLQQVYDGVHTDMPLGLENGLAGIGYGTTLLYEHGWVGCDLNDILFDIDAKIMERDPRRLTDYSVRSGIKGLSIYLVERQKSGSPIFTFDNRYLSEIQSILANVSPMISDINIIDIINEPSFSDCEYIDKPIGIDGGSAFYLLKDALT